jgi:hypothetical protein
MGKGTREAEITRGIHRQNNTGRRGPGSGNGRKVPEPKFESAGRSAYLLDDPISDGTQGRHMESEKGKGIPGQEMPQPDTLNEVTVGDLPQSLSG